MKVKFKGFAGEDLTVRVVKGGKGIGDHHHLEVWHDGKMLWSAHLWKDAISLWNAKFNVSSKGEGNVYITLGGR